MGQQWCILSPAPSRRQVDRARDRFEKVCRDIETMPMPYTLPYVVILLLVAILSGWGTTLIVPPDKPRDPAPVFVLDHAATPA